MTKAMKEGSARHLELEKEVLYYKLISCIMRILSLSKYFFS